jgi:transposase
MNPTNWDAPSISRVIQSPLHGEPRCGISYHGALPDLIEQRKASIPAHYLQCHGTPGQAFNTQKRHQAPRSRPGSWTPGEIKKLINLRSKGCTWTDISEELPGRSHLACRLRWQKHQRMDRLDKVARFDDRYLVHSQPESPITHYSMDSRYKSDRWLMAPKQYIPSQQATESIQWRETTQEIPGRATGTSCANTATEMNIVGSTRPQIIPTRITSLPGIAGSREPQIKQNTRLPPIRTIFGDLLNGRGSSQGQP